MKIVSLTAENVKRLVAVQIKPDGNLVQITGKNGQGKSSVLDAIWWALAGSSNIQQQPIRNGQQRAMIRLDLGKLVVTRTFNRKGEHDYTTQIAVENAEGAKYKSPQALIDGLLSSLSFDPLAFSRMKPREQFDTLRAFVPDVDFEEIDGLNRAAFDRRTTANRLAKEARGAASLITVADDIPDEPIDDSALVKELREAGDKNAAEVSRRSNRTAAQEKIKTLRAAAADALNRIQPDTEERQQKRDEAVRDIERQIAALQSRLIGVREEWNESIVRQAAAYRDQAEKSTKEADILEERIRVARPLEDPIDTVAIEQQIDNARKVNAQVQRKTERNKHIATAERYERESEQLTDDIETRNRAKQKAIAKAKMPIPGLDFGDGIVLLAGVPFEQASDAERLRASVAIAMAQNPELRVIRIRDGSLLDEDAMKLLAEMANEHDMQCWVERVDSTGSVGFVLEDGHVRGSKKKQAEPEGAAA